MGDCFSEDRYKSQLLNPQPPTTIRRRSSLDRPKNDQHPPKGQRRSMSSSKTNEELKQRFQIMKVEKERDIALTEVKIDKLEKQLSSLHSTPDVDGMTVKKQEAKLNGERQKLQREKRNLLKISGRM